MQWPTMVDLLLYLLLLAAPVYCAGVTRDQSGDLFQLKSCLEDCISVGAFPAGPETDGVCSCRCASTHPAYREDKRQCVKDIKECYMSVFYRRPFTVEAIPHVYLPTAGQLVHPDAHLSLSGRRDEEGGFPSCRASVSQYLTPEGWRTITKYEGGGPVFGLFLDANKTFLQFVGSGQDRRVLRQRLSMVRLFCRVPGYAPFETCVAFRVGATPGLEPDEPDDPGHRANLTVVGASLGILALVYLTAVLVYLRVRRRHLARKKKKTDAEASDPDPEVASHSRLERSYHTSTLTRGQGEPWSQMSSVVETYNGTWTDRMGQQVNEFRAEDFKIQPEFFEPEVMASPPPEVLEYLERLQNSVTFARHRLRSCYRYQPTLNNIPEDDYFYQEFKGSPSKELRTTPDGGSASSVVSFTETLDGNDEDGFKMPPRPPPKKPKRKNAKSKDIKPSEQEQKDIQNAMNTLNDTLDALEYDMYKQDIGNKNESNRVRSSRNGETRKSRNKPEKEQQSNSSYPNSNVADLEDFDTSSCSSLSAVTVLGKEAKKQIDVASNGSLSVERNQSEDFHTFRNSTFSVGGKCIPSPDEEGKDVRKSATQKTNQSLKRSFAINSKSESRNFPKRKLGPQQGFTDPKKTTNNKEDQESATGRSCGKSSETVSTSDDAKPKKCHGYQNPVEEEPNPRNRKPDKRRLLKKSSSTESLTTIASDMTTDSLESTSPSRRHERRHRSPASPTPSMVDAWISKLIQNSVQYTKTRRKPKKLVLPEDEVHNWEHVCQKQKDSCPMHELNDANLIEKLAQYSSKSATTGKDVAGYFHSLKQDVLKEQLKTWLITNHHGKKQRKSATTKNRKKECSHKRQQVNNSVVTSAESVQHPLWAAFNSKCDGNAFSDSLEPTSIDSTSELLDSLEFQKINCIVSE